MEGREASKMCSNGSTVEPHAIIVTITLVTCPIYAIQQVQCVREALLRMSSMYTDLAMRSDLPASTKAVQVNKYLSTFVLGYATLAHCGEGNFTTTKKGNMLCN